MKEEPFVYLVPYTPKDVVAFSKRFVRAPPRMHQVPLKEFNHGDFVSARDQAKYVHEPILAYAREIRQKTGTTNSTAAKWRQV